MESIASQDWDGGGHAHFVGPRRYAILDEPARPFVGPPGPWLLYAGVLDQLVGGRQVGAFLTFVVEDSVYGLAGAFAGLDEVERRFRGSFYGRTIGAWRPVPDEVGANVAETVAWLLAQARSHG